jgi:RNA polymerase sigma-70 factor (ECF subfamily)
MFSPVPQAIIAGTEVYAAMASAELALNSKPAVDWPLHGRHLRRVRSSERVTDTQVVSWVKQAQSGRREAFDALTRHFSPLVHGILLAHAPRTEVDDLLQEVFIKAWQGLSGLREPEAFGSWLATFARNRATDFHRRKRSEVSIDLVELADPGAGRHAEAVRILELIRTLPETYREALVLRLVEGLTGPEIAQHTGLTHGSVRVNLHRGLQLLREKLGVKK